MVRKTLIIQQTSIIIGTEYSKFKKIIDLFKLNIFENGVLSISRDKNSRLVNLLSNKLVTKNSS